MMFKEWQMSFFFYFRKHKLITLHMQQHVIYYVYSKSEKEITLMKTYKKILKEVEQLQRDLMGIENYNEEVYQGLQTTIDELEYLIEEGEVK